LFCLRFSRNIENREYHTAKIPHDCYRYIQANRNIQHVPSDNINIWIRLAPLVEQELPAIPRHLCSPPVFSGVHVTRSFVLICMFCRSLFVFLYFFFWPLYCLFFCDIRILITSLISSNSSYYTAHSMVYLGNDFSWEMIVHFV
jgi:hypothetical protein